VKLCLLSFILGSSAHVDYLLIEYDKHLISVNTTDN